MNKVAWAWAVLLGTCVFLGMALIAFSVSLGFPWWAGFGLLGYRVLVLLGTLALTCGLLWASLTIYADRERGEGD